MNVAKPTSESHGYLLFMYLLDLQSVFLFPHPKKQTKLPFHTTMTAKQYSTLKEWRMILDGKQGS